MTVQKQNALEESLRYVTFSLVTSIFLQLTDIGLFFASKRDPVFLSYDRTITHIIVSFAVWGLLFSLYGAWGKIKARARSSEKLFVGLIGLGWCAMITVAMSVLIPMSKVLPMR